MSHEKLLTPFTTFLVVVIWNTSAIAQTDSTLKEFYPLQLGNVWQYRDQNNILGTGQVGIADTIPSNGQHYFGLGKPPDYSTGYGLVRIDSLLRVQNFAPYGDDTCGGANGEVNIFRLNEPIGGVWNICDNIVTTLCRPWFMRLESISTANIFGQPRQVMRFTPGAYCSETGDTVWYFVDWLLVKGIGVYRAETIEGNYSYLTGAIINGIQYGTIVSVDDLPSTFPNSFRLDQNYPEPFNPVTTISFSIPKHTHVLLQVFNPLGQLITTLVDESKNPGTYTAAWDAGTRASGLYFYRMTAGEFVQTKKAILVK